MKRNRVLYSLGGFAMILFAIGHTIGHLIDPRPGMTPADLEVWTLIEGHTFRTVGGGLNVSALLNALSLYLSAFTFVVGVESIWTARRAEIPSGYLRGRALFNALLSLALGVITLTHLKLLPPLVLSFIAAACFGAAAAPRPIAPGTPDR